MTVYADVLFFIDFSMDFLTLYLAARITHTPPKKGRLLASAAVGALGGTLLTIVQPGDSLRWLSIPAGLILSFIMTLIALGVKQPPDLLIRDFLLIWGVGVSLGGVMTWLMSLGTPVFLQPHRGFPAVYALCLIGAILFTRIEGARRRTKTATVIWSAGPYGGSFTALCDSGSFAADPISGRAAILVKKEALGGITMALANPEAGLHYRLIPIAGVCGEKLLSGFVPDSVTVNGRKVEAVLAVADSDFAGYDGLIPAVLL